MSSLRIPFLGRVGAVVMATIIAGGSVLLAETPAVPSAATAPSATAKWLAEQGPQWQAAFDAEVTAPFEKGAAELAKQYLSALDGQFAAATRAGQLTEAVAFRDETQRLTGGGRLGEDDANTPAGLKALRAGYRKNLAALEAERAAKAKAVHARYDAILAQNQTLLTQNQRLDEAIQLKSKREELAAAWVTPFAAAEVNKTAGNAGVKPPGAPAPGEATMYVAADNGYSVWLNGKLLGWGDRLANPDKYEIQIATGDCLSILAWDQGPGDRTAGLFCCIIIKATHASIGTDTSWKCSTRRQTADWYRKGAIVSGLANMSATNIHPNHRDKLEGIRKRFDPAMTGGFVWSKDASATIYVQKTIDLKAFK